MVTILAIYFLSVSDLMLGDTFPGIIFISALIAITGIICTYKLLMVFLGMV